MSLLFETPLIAGLRVSENVISHDEEQQLLAHLAGIELAPFRFHGWVAIGAPKASAGAMISRTRLSRLQSRSLNGLRGCAQALPPSPELRRRISSTFFSPATIPVRASDGIAIATCSRRSSGFR